MNWRPLQTIQFNSLSYWITHVFGLLCSFKVTEKKQQSDERDEQCSVVSTFWVLEKKFVCEIITDLFRCISSGLSYTRIDDDKQLNPFGIHSKSVLFFGYYNYWWKTNFPILSYLFSKPRNVRRGTWKTYKKKLKDWDEDQLRMRMNSR